VLFKQNQGWFKEELLFSRKSFRDEEKAGGGNADQGAEEEVPDSLLTGANPG